MESILWLAHTEEDGLLGKHSLEALAAARHLARLLPSAAFSAGLAGSQLEAAANRIGGCGAARFWGVAGAGFGVPRYATDAAAAEALVRASGATLVVVPSTSRWARCLAGVALRVNGRIDTHITGISVMEQKLTVSRWFYRQRMEALLSRTHRPWFLTVDPGCFEPWNGEPARAQVELLDVSPDSRTRFVEYRAPQAGEQTIRPDAKLLFVAGAGWTKKQPDGQAHVEEAAELILTFLRKSQASLGSSKSLVDLSSEGQAVLPFLSHLNQVGQTGSTPRHPKGLATCCHGEEPHVVGWRFIHERRAVNLDPNCGWAHGKADVLYVADAFAVMRKLNELL